MSDRSGRVPFVERGGTLRGILDLATGCYPAFLFGRPIGRLLPVFHLHEATVAYLEPRFQHLAENGYRTADADAIAHYARDGVWPGARTVALTFDDARASLWTVAAPLLRKYGLTAITFAIPGRITDAAAARPTLDEGAAASETADTSDTPFVTWPELEALHASGLVDVQSHTHMHAAIFCSDRPVSFVTPAYAADHLLNRPLISEDGPAAFLPPSALGAPLYARRSRMSDGLRFLVAEAALERPAAHVAANGGTAFFARMDWRRELETRLPTPQGEFEREDAQVRAIERELDESRAVLDERLGPGTVRHLALPWGITGEITRRALGRGGYESAFAQRLFVRQGVRVGDDPFMLHRLNGNYIFCLPGNGRRYAFSVR